VGASQSAPILITAITAYLAMDAVKYALASREYAKKRAEGGRPRPGDEPPAASVDPSGAGS
jgi:hypothetical protein